MVICMRASTVALANVREPCVRHGSIAATTPLATACIKPVNKHTECNAALYRVELSSRLAVQVMTSEVQAATTAGLFR